MLVEWRDLVQKTGELPSPSTRPRCSSRSGEGRDHFFISIT
jgi:hypothetical protein